MKPKRTRDRSLFLTVIGLLLASLALAQSVRAAQDTVFLKKRVPGGNNMIFIDPSPTSIFYSQFDTFWFFSHEPRNEGDSLLMNELHFMDSEISRGHGEHHPKEIQDLAGQWYPVYRYRDAYYLYKPSDGMNARTVFFTDSALLSVGGDGADQLYYPLRGVTKSGPHKYSIDIGVLPNPSNKTGLSKCTMERMPQDSTIYKLDMGGVLTGMMDPVCLIRAKDVRKFPIIVNYSVDQKEHEVQFDGNGNVRIR